MDAIIRAAVAEPDETKRKAFYAQAYQRVLDGHYFVVLGHSQEIIAWRREVQGFQPGFTWSPNWASGGIAHTWLDAQG
jgi:ABC-type transport system substrate-binding protein